MDQILSGIEPVRKLSPNCKVARAVSEQILSGREPVSLFSSTCKVVSAVSELIHSGMVPVKPLAPRYNADKFPKLQRGSGREPTSLLEERSR